MQIFVNLKSLNYYQYKWLYKTLEQVGYLWRILQHISDGHYERAALPLGEQGKNVGQGTKALLFGEPLDTGGSRIDVVLAEHDNRYVVNSGSVILQIYKNHH